MKPHVAITHFEWIIIGFILHAFGGIFFDSSKVICFALCGLGLIIMFLSGFFQTQVDVPFKGVVRHLFIFYLLWSVFIIAFPFFSTEPFSTDGYSLINQVTWLSLTTPLIILLGFKHLSLHAIFKFSYIYGIVGVILFVLNYHAIFDVKQEAVADYQDYIGVAGIPVQFLSTSSFMVLCYSFVSPKYRIVSFATLGLAVFIVLFTARRGSVFMFLLIFFFTFYLYIFNSQKGLQVLKLVLVAFLCIVGIAIFNLLSGSVFSFFLSRLDEDTRKGVEDYFYANFKGQTLDWIVGRGINGTYYCPAFTNLNLTSNREVIETGYLQLVLKGGIMYLFLFIFFLAHSAYLGLFRTQNMLTKAMALYLVAHIIYLIPYGLPAFNFEYILVWICVLYCQSNEWRTYTDVEIKRYLSISS